jgi:pimeloyl-ACP methyl ester carboxylesterase
MSKQGITEHELSIQAGSDHPQLAATLRLPATEAGTSPQRRPAIIVLHGFGSTRQAPNVTVPASLYAQWGYVALSFDMPGCGQSGGTPGHVLCLDQVAATRAAMAVAATRRGCVTALMPGMPRKQALAPRAAGGSGAPAGPGAGGGGAGGGTRCSSPSGVP